MSKCVGHLLCVCAVSLFTISIPLYAVETAIPQQLLDWQKAAGEFTAKGDLSGAAQYYEKIISSSSIDCKSMPTMPQNLYDLAGRFEASGQVDKAIVFYQAGVNWSADSNKSWGIWNDPAFYQMLSQANLIKISIRNKDITAAQTASDVFKTKYSDQPTLAKEIHQIADTYAESGQQEKAFELYRFNAVCPANNDDSFKPDNVWLDPEFYRMKSQVVVIRQQIQNNDFSGAESGCEVLTTRYVGQSTLPAEIYQIAQAYQNAGQSDKAAALHQVNAKLPVPEGGISFQPQSVWEDPEVCRMWSQVEIIRKLVRDRDFAGAQAASKTLMTRFKDVRLLPREMYLIAEDYEAAGQGDKAQVLYQAAAQIPKPQKACYESRSFYYDPDLYRMESQRKVVEYCIDKQDFAGADKEYQSLLEQYKDHPTLPQEIGRVATKYARADQTSKAMELAQFLLDQNADKTWQICGHVAMARVYVYLGQDAKVQEKVEYLLSNFKDDPNDQVIYLFEIAEDYLLIADELFHTGKSGEINSKCQNALVILEHLLDWPSETVFVQHAWYSMGTALRLMKDYENAAGYYEAVVDLWPDYIYGWNAQFFVGHCYEELIKTSGIESKPFDSKIKEAYKKTIEQYPDGGLTRLAYLNLGDLYQRQKQYAEAIKYYEQYLVKAKSHDPYQERVKWDLAWLYDKTGDVLQSQALYDQLIQIPKGAFRQKIMDKEVSKRNQLDAELQPKEEN